MYYLLVYFEYEYCKITNTAKLYNLYILLKNAGELCKIVITIKIK